ncbi:hypothetical protein JOF41_001471 [Saccharothrix coeruleofusca]|nr:hypothetical protein [Saccharothrix coeruleofusca]
MQVSDRWHLWRNLCDKVLLEIRAHAGCWATVNPPRRSSRADRPRTPEQGPRATRPRRRPARLFTAPRHGPKHRQTLCPHARTPRFAHRPHLPPDAGRPLPRPPARPPRRRSRDSGYPPAGADPEIGLHRQRQPAGPLPQPGPRRKRPPSRPHVTPVASC